MQLTDLQARIRANTTATTNPFSNGTQIMLALTEEMGEVAQEVALLERIGTKAAWQKDSSVERLGEEISHALNCLVALANHFEIDLERVFETQKQPS